MNVVVPQGVPVGGTFQVQTPTGQIMDVQVPAGVMPGQQIQVQPPPPVVVPSQVVPVSYPNPSLNSGLDMLAHLSSVKIVQKVDGLEAALQAIGIPYEKGNTYSVMDEGGNVLFRAVEESSCLCRTFCHPHHEFTLHLFDANHNIVMTMKRPFACGQCCTPCGVSKMDVYTGGDTDNPANFLTKIRIPVCGGGCTPTINFEDESENVYAALKGPMCCISEFCDVRFRVMHDGQESGELRKLGANSSGGQGMMTELLTEADTFIMRFPEGLAPNQKAGMIASVLMTDYLFFEDGGAFQCDPIQQSFSIKCCHMYCCGCSCPCKCKCGGQSEDGDDSGGPVRPEPEQMER